MLAPLANSVYRQLFFAHVIALLGAGLATVALALLAFDLAGDKASVVLGAAFTIKMLAYVGLGPIAGALAERIDRRKLLIGLDIARAGMALTLPFVTEIWQIYGLIFALYASTAIFTPTFQATIPDILPDPEDYTKALSLSRLAYDIENILSPALAALLLSILSYNALFLGASAGFAASGLFILSVLLPSAKTAVKRSVYDSTAKGIRLYLATPRLRGLLALNMAAAGAGAMVLVNSAYLVRGPLGLDESALALTMLAFGAGSMVSALFLPGLLNRCSDRSVMLTAGIATSIILGALGFSVLHTGLNWPTLLAAWSLLGLAYSAALTPAGRLIRQSAEPENYTPLFGAQFALSHLCWLVTYPLAAWLIINTGAAGALLGLALLTLGSGVIAKWAWPASPSPLHPASEINSKRKAQP